MPTVEDLGKLVKTKYPQYGSIPDADLGRKVKAKYPQYAQFTDIAVSSSAPAAKKQTGPPESAWSPGTMARSFGRSSLGILQGAGQTAYNLMDIATGGYYSKLTGGPGKSFDPIGPEGNIGKTGEQIGEFFLPVPGVAKLEAARVAAKSPFLKMLYGAGREFLQNAAISTAQTGSLKEGAKTGAVAAPFGAMGEATKALSGPLRESAEKTYARVLSPTTKPNKYLARKVLEEGGKGTGQSLLDRRVLAFTERGLERKLATKAAESEARLEDAYNTLGPNAKVKILPILDDIQKFAEEKAVAPIDVAQQAQRGSAQVGGRPGNIVNPELYRAAQNMQTAIIDRLAPLADTASLESVRKLRQVLDKPLSMKAMFSGKLPVTVQDQAEKVAADAIRREIAGQYPDIAKVNAEYSFWQAAKDVMSAAVERKTGQEGLLKRVMPRMAGAMAGGVLGYQHGGVSAGIEGAALVGLAYETLNHALTSPAWRTVSAVSKNEVARLLAKGEADKAAKLAARLTAYTTEKKGQ